MDKRNFNMMCHKCMEKLTSGEACIPVFLNGSNHVRLYHPGCYAEMKDEQKKAEERLENVVRMARSVH